MKTFANLLTILFICIACTKVAVRVYGHFHPPAATITGP